ncbi:MAG: acetyl-CoA hydrolase/transferase C-terminal domain-containing protein, partial [Bacteroidota bacterium]
GANIRRSIPEGHADYIPVFLSEMPALFRDGGLPLDVALIQVSPPDMHGYCTLGASLDIARAAVASAQLVIAQINPQVPRSHGDSLVHMSQIDFAVEVNVPLPVLNPRPITPIEQKIGMLIASMVEDGATLQMGIGGIPDAVLSQLGGHKKLGVHTEMFADGLIDLVQKGVITGEDKRVLPGRIVASFAMGSQRVYDFIDDNPIICMKEASFTNDTHIIRKNPKVTAINSAIEIDLTGQVCADSIGTMQYSGVGGQMDFIRGAALSEGGKPIIALPSITRKGLSKIVPTLQTGASVTTTRAHVHYVVTEHGVAYLYGKNLRQRAKALINIAHPDHREALSRAAYARYGKLD